MTYLCCEACGFRTARGPLNLASYCPRCRTHGRIVPFTEAGEPPSTTTIAPTALHTAMQASKRQDVAPWRA